VSSKGANDLKEAIFGDGSSRVVAYRACPCVETGLRPLLLVGPNGGESEELDTDGTRVGRVCGGKDGEGGTDVGDGALGSASRVTFDLILIGPPPPLPTTEEEPEWFSSFDVVSASLGGE
jgi:hypothetical protein